MKRFNFQPIENMEASLQLARFQTTIWKAIKEFESVTFSNPQVQRQINFLSFWGTAALPENQYQQLESLTNDMEEIYSRAKVCCYNNQSDCSLQQDDVADIVAHSRDPKELRYLWVAWRAATGRKIRGMYEQYVDLLNEAADLNNLTSAVDLWLSPYEDDDIAEKVQALWHNLQPLYFQLHAYVRRKLRDRYGEEAVPMKEPIPAHLIGNLWGQSWSNLYNISLPYPQKVLPDITTKMQDMGYTPKRMFKEAENFFKSINLSSMTSDFWNNSIIEKPPNVKEIICHASAWDMNNGKDFRIKMCTQPNLDDFITVHHEMGHIEYYQQYKHQPLVFREGANPGFHEAIGDVVALSVCSPGHMHHLGFLHKSELHDDEADMNYLFSMALQKVAFLPFAYVVDKWRWDVFQGRTHPPRYNQHWWRLKENHQGLTPPEVRQPEDFDPGSKYHIAAGIPYLRYFISTVIQFQFHMALCRKAGQFDPLDLLNKPLHKCDIYQNKAAGNLLAKMLEMGSSKPWPDAMEALTGQRCMDASGMLEYFRPLHKWLEEENDRTAEYVGWVSKPLNKICPAPTQKEPTVTTRKKRKKKKRRLG